MLPSIESFNLSVENIAERTGVVPKIHIFSVNGLWESFEDAEGWRRTE